MEARLKEALVTVSAAAVGTVASYAIYTGSQSVFKTDNKYVPAAVEFGLGALLIWTLRHPFWHIVGGVMIAQGILDMMYAANVLTVQL